MSFLLLLGFTGSLPAETFAPGDRAGISVDLNGDHVGEMLVVTSYEHDPEIGSPFEFDIELTDPRGNQLFYSEEIGEMGWFSVEKSDFEYEDGRTREVAFIRAGCFATGVHVNSTFLYQPPGAKDIHSLWAGNDGLYDLNRNGVPDLLVSVFRMHNLGVYGNPSPWLPTFSRPSSLEDWGLVDVTFEVLGQDAEYRAAWIEGLGYTYEALAEYPEDPLVGPEHIGYLKMLIDALEANDMDEARQVYYTAF